MFGLRPSSDDLRFAKVGCGVTAHTHVRLQFRCLGNADLRPESRTKNRLNCFEFARSSTNMGLIGF